MRLLELASFACTVIVVSTPDVPAGTVAVDCAAAAAPAATAKLFDVPVLPPLVAVIVNVPLFEGVTACEASTPPTKCAVPPPPADAAPADVMFTVPVTTAPTLLASS